MYFFPTQKSTWGRRLVWEDWLTLSPCAILPPETVPKAAVGSKDSLRMGIALLQRSETFSFKGPGTSMGPNHVATKRPGCQTSGSDQHGVWLGKICLPPILPCAGYGMTESPPWQTGSHIFLYGPSFPCTGWTFVCRKSSSM